MMDIDNAIIEAKAEETKPVKANKISNTVTLTLEEYINLYTSTDKYCRLMGIISTSVAPCSYESGLRITDGREIMEFIKYNELELFSEMLNYAKNRKGDEE